MINQSFSSIFFQPFKFSDKFRKKAGFPQRPELVSNINNLTDFVPGRVQVFEDIITKEQGGQEQEDNNLLTIIGAGEITDASGLSATEEEESEEEERSVAEILPVTMP